MHARILAAFLPLAILVSACSGGGSAFTGPTSKPAEAANTPTPTSDMTRTSEGGQVTVVVDWAGRDSGAGFDVTLDTHTVDLDAVDLADAILRNDRGETLPAGPWTAPRGGHHREGELPYRGDATAFLADVEWVELVLFGIGDLPERTFRWETQS